MERLVKNARHRSIARYVIAETPIADKASPNLIRYLALESHQEQ
jgi:hypothetical protein